MERAVSFIRLRGCSRVRPGRHSPPPIGPRMLLQRNLMMKMILTVISYSRSRVRPGGYRAALALEMLKDVHTILPTDN